MLAETASVEAGDGGAKKAAWIRSLLLDLPSKFPRIRALMWFDWALAGDESMPIDSSPRALEAFSSSIQHPRYLANDFAQLAASPIPPPAAGSTSTPATGAGDAAQQTAQQGGSGAGSAKRPPQHGTKHKRCAGSGRHGRDRKAARRHAKRHGRRHRAASRGHRQGRHRTRSPHRCSGRGTRPRKGAKV
jgi:hypothetical protein